MKNRGFTLIEILIAAGLMVGLLVGLMNLYVFCFNLQDESKDVGNVMQLMRQEMEIVKGLAFNDIVAHYEVLFDKGLPPESIAIWPYPYQIDMSSIGLNGMIRIEATYAKDSLGANVPNLMNIRVVAGWVQKHTGKIIGDGNNGSGKYQFNAAPPTSAKSPYVLETAVVSKT